VNSAPLTAASQPGASRGFLRRWLFTTNARRIGILYLWLGLTAVTLGTILSLLMRIHRVWPKIAFPGHGVIRPEDYLALVTMHGTLMIFFVLTVVPQNAFPNLVLPRQIGAPGMAFPRLNAAAFWITALSFLVLLSAFFVPQGAPISGWTSYPPFSAIPSAGPGEGAGMDCWLASIALFCIGSVAISINLLTTILVDRAPGMRWSRLPLTVWAWFVSSILTLLAFSVLLAAALLLLCDRHLGTSFFIPMGDLVNGQIVGHGDGTPLLWLHLFWFFGHPEVYIAILPGMGLASSLIANFTGRRVQGYKFLAGALIVIGGLGLVVWGHHMFVSGMNPYAGTAFALTTMAIAIPSSAEVLAWLVALWPGGLRLQSPMLFTLGFISFFIAGGLTGPILAQPSLDAYLHNTFFVVAHFHLVMGMATMFSIFAGIYYWFPLLCGRRMSEGLARIHFYVSLIAGYGTFFPMHFAGFAGEPRHYSQLNGPVTSFASILPLERGITFAALLLASAQLVFVYNVFRSLRSGPLAGDNPWQATTLEWAPAAFFRAGARVDRPPYEYNVSATAASFTPQWEKLAEQE
jgi:cytochrome c oxidase subunit I